MENAPNTETCLETSTGVMTGGGCHELKISVRSAISMVCSNLWYLLEWTAGKLMRWDTADWDYGDATSSPPHNAVDMCQW